MIFYRRNLPHIFVENGIYFVTYRLAGTIPVKVIKEWHEEFLADKRRVALEKDPKKREAIQKRMHRLYFGNLEKYLHKSKINRLSDPKVAAIVKDSLEWGDTKKYALFAYTIMPNHVHLILQPKTDKEKPESEYQKLWLTEILQSIKKYSAREANKILNKTGQFWHHESYDHIVRNEKELIRIINYILMNPVKAKLTSTPDNYPWNYVNWDLLG